MMQRQWLFLIILLLTANALFAKSAEREEFIISNNSNSDVIVNVEFWYGPESALPDPRHPNSRRAEGSWPQIVSGITLSIQCFQTISGTNVIPPNRHAHIISYHVPGPRELFDRIVVVPFIEKMNAIFKRLEIIYNEGQGIITLADLGEIEIKVEKPWPGLVMYILEIFDRSIEE